MQKSYPPISLTKKNQIFVFGSNLAGRHGKGAALAAYKNYGAEYGVGVGRTGRCYAIPTKSQLFMTLPLPRIWNYVDDFIEYAKKNPKLEFLVTPFGTGLAGYDHKDIMIMFEERILPNNIIFPQVWLDLWGQDKR